MPAPTNPTRLAAAAWVDHLGASRPETRSTLPDAQAGSVRGAHELELERLTAGSSPGGVAKPQVAEPTLFLHPTVCGFPQDASPPSGAQPEVASHTHGE